MLFDFKKLMDGAKELLTDIDCVPIFSTIPTINILYWITIRYQQGQTGYLKYESIPQMQENLNFILLNVNKSIIMFNNSNEETNHTYIKCLNYVDMSRGLIITTYMLMGSIQMEIYWQSGPLV